MVTGVAGVATREALPTLALLGLDLGKRVAAMLGSRSIVSCC